MLSLSQLERAVLAAIRRGVKVKLVCDFDESNKAYSKISHLVDQVQRLRESESEPMHFELRAPSGVMHTKVS